MGRNGSQFLLLLWKNWTLQKKKKVLTAFEIGLPTFFSLVLLMLRQVVTPEEYTNPAVWPGFLVEGLPDSFKYLPENTTDKWRLVYSPNNTVVRKIMADVTTRLDVQGNFIHVLYKSIIYIT